MPGRLSDSQIAGKHPSGLDRRACRAYPLGQLARARAGRTFCDPRTSCGHLYVLRIRWLLLECGMVGHTVDHRCVLTLPVMLQNWLKCLHRAECWSRRGDPIPSPAPFSRPEGPWTVDRTFVVRGMASGAASSTHVMPPQLRRPPSNRPVSASSTPITSPD